MMAAKNLTDIVLLGEGCQAEFKRTLPSRLKELTAEVCALANAISLYRPIKFEEWVKGWVEKLTKNRLMKVVQREAAGLFTTSNPIVGRKGG